jgi:hypothetical protein
MMKNLTYNKTSVVQLLVVLFILFSLPQGYAQKYSIGLKAGASLTWPGFGDPEAKDIFSRRLKPGFQVGFLIGFPLRKNYDLLLEGGYSQRGRILTFNNDNAWKNEMTMTMTDMSMMLRRSFTFMFKENTPVDAFVNIGPEINYWLSAKGFVRVTDGPKYKYDVVFDEVAPEDGERYMTISEANRWLFSLGIGFGFKAPLHRRQHLTTEFRFLSGHTFLGKQNSAFMDGFIWGDGNMQDTMRTNLKTMSVTLAYTLDFDVVESRKGKSNIKKRLKKT